MPSERQWQAAEQKAEYYNSKISEYHKNYVEKDDSREYTLRCTPMFEYYIYSA